MTDMTAKTYTLPREVVSIEGIGNSRHTRHPSPISSALNFHPLYRKTGVCETLACFSRVYRIEVCREMACPHRWQREATADRARRDARDRIAVLCLKP